MQFILDTQSRHVVNTVAMNGLHLCHECHGSFELDELNWNTVTLVGTCDACTRQKYALRACYVACHACGKTFEIGLTEDYLVTGTASCTACSASTS